MAKRIRLAASIIAAVFCGLGSAYAATETLIEIDGTSTNTGFVASNLTADRYFDVLRTDFTLTDSYTNGVVEADIYCGSCVGYAYLIKDGGPLTLDTPVTHWSSATTFGNALSPEHQTIFSGLNFSAGTYSLIFYITDGFLLWRTVEDGGTGDAAILTQFGTNTAVDDFQADGANTNAAAAYNSTFSLLTAPSPPPERLVYRITGDTDSSSGPPIDAVPLPAGAFLALTGFGALLLARRRR